MPEEKSKKRWKLLIVVLLGVLIGRVVLAKYPDLFYKDKPIGLCEAHLPNKPNWVSSLVLKDDSHYIAPLPRTRLADIAACITKLTPDAQLVASYNKIEGYRRTAVLGFTDWFCIDDNGNITSSATMGYSDLGNNRQWVDNLSRHLKNYNCLN